MKRRTDKKQNSLSRTWWLDFYYSYSIGQLIPKNFLLLWTGRSLATCCYLLFQPWALCQTGQKYAHGPPGRNGTVFPLHLFASMQWNGAQGKRSSATENARSEYSSFSLWKMYVGQHKLSNRRQLTLSFPSQHITLSTKPMRNWLKLLSQDFLWSLKEGSSI